MKYILYTNNFSVEHYQCFPIKVGVSRDSAYSKAMEHALKLKKSGAGCVVVKEVTSQGVSGRWEV